MPDNRSECVNNDHAVVKITFRHTGTENMTLNRGQTDSIVGPQDEEFKYAWKIRDELITDDEVARYGAQARYGDTLVFGNPPGKVP